MRGSNEESVGSACRRDQKKRQTRKLEILSCGMLLLLLTVLDAVPLPFGGGVFWGTGLACAAIFSIATICCVLYLIGKVELTAAWKQGRWTAFLMSLTLVWLVAQTFPIDLTLLKQISPVAADRYAAADPTAAGAISLNVSATQTQALITAACLVLYALALQLLNSREKLRWFCWAAVIGGVLQASYGAIMVLSGYEYGFFIQKTAYLGTATGTFVNRNHLAGYLEMAIAVGIGLMLMYSSPKTDAPNWRKTVRRLIDLMLSWKPVLRLGLVVMVVGLVMTHSRMGNTSFMVGLMFTGTLLLAAARVRGPKKDTTRNVTGLLILLVSIVLVDVFVISNWFGLEELVERLGQVQEHSAGRLEVDTYLWPMWKAFTLVGCGAGAFASVFPMYVTDPVDSAEFSLAHAHNDLAEFPIEFGLIGFLPLVTVVVLTTWAALKMVWLTEDRLCRGAGTATLMSIISLTTHSSADFNLQLPGNAFLFVAILALPAIAKSVEARTKVEVRKQLVGVEKDPEVEFGGQAPSMVSATHKPKSSSKGQDATDLGLVGGAFGK